MKISGFQFVDEAGQACAGLTRTQVFSVHWCILIDQISCVEVSHPENAVE